jgi:hypothetical protein
MTGVVPEPVDSPATPAPPPHAARALRRLVDVLETPVKRLPWWVGVGIAAVYTTVVVVTACFHEPWRDEVVALSVAREMPSLGALWHVLRHEGHPILWYLLLRGAYFTFHTTRVLLPLGVATAIAAVVVFLARAPLPLWFQVLFVFGYFPVFEYAVVARANGLAMLLVFAACAAAAERERRPVLLATCLALLANTSPQAFLVAAAAGAMIAVDAVTWTTRPPIWRHGGLAVVVYAAGMLHAVVSNMPDRTVLPTQLYPHDLGTVLAAVRHAVVHPVANSAGVLGIPYPSVWIWLCFVALIRRPGLLAFLSLGLLASELMFILVYYPQLRHMGYVVLIVVATLWMWEDAGPRAVVERWLRRVLFVPLVAGLAFQVYLGAGFVLDEIRLDYSSGGRLAALLAGDPRLEHAIVIGEPEDLTTSLPYYRANPIFLPQEDTFRDWLFIQKPGGRRADYNLGELLATATRLRDRYQTPVVMALGWYVDGPELQRAYYGTYFEQTFTVTPAERTEFLARTELLGKLRAASFTDENYDVFVLW